MLVQEATRLPAVQRWPELTPSLDGVSAPQFGWMEMIWGCKALACSPELCSRLPHANPTDIPRQQSQQVSPNQAITTTFSHIH